MDVISVGPLTSYGLHLGAALIYKPKALLSIVSSVFIISFSSRGSCLSAKGLVCQKKYTPCQKPITSICSQFHVLLGFYSNMLLNL